MTTFDNSNVTTEAVAEPEAPSETSGSLATAELKAYNKRLEAENRELKRGALEKGIAALDLDPSKELGLAVMKHYPVKDQPVTEEAIAEWTANEYEYSPPTAPAAVEVADAIDAGNAVAEGIESISEPVAPITSEDEIAQLDAKLADPESTRQDATRSISQKMQGFEFPR